MRDAASAWQIVGPAVPALLVASVAASWLLIVALRPLFKRFALAVPTARSSHTSLTPQWGGIAVVAATVGVAAAALLLLPEVAPTTVHRTAIVLAAALLLAAVGAVDDMRNLGAAPKLLGQVVAVAMVVSVLPPELRVLPLLPEWAERALTVLGGVWFVNIVNFMDGIDWMLVAEIVPVTAGVALIAAIDGLPVEAPVVALALCGAMLGFAPFNRPVASLFIGDMGSLPVGLLTGWLLLVVAGAGHVAAALLLPLYFIADTTLTLLHRARAGEKLWVAHRTHFYQRAGDAGFDSLQVVARVFAANVGLVALAALSVVLVSPVADAALVAAGIVLVGFLLTSLARGRP